MSSEPASFRQRLRQREVLLGSFVKTPTIHATEILGALGFHFVVIDEEHAPFDRAATDHVIFAARSVGLASLVRVQDATPARLLSVLDCGATGLLVPHVNTPEKARQIAAAGRYIGGSRGYSGSPRAAGYGAIPMSQYLAAADAQTTIIAQIEDADALDHVDAIARVEGIDALFIGRGDLSVSFGAPSSDAPEVRAAVQRIASAAAAADKPVMVFSNSLAEAKWLNEIGATAFVVASDQSFLRRGAAKALEEMAALTGQPRR